MPSDAAKKRQAQKREKRQASARGGGQKKASSTVKEAPVTVVEGASSSGGACATVDSVTSEVESLKISERSCTGVLSSHPSSLDVHVHNFSVTFHGSELLTDTVLELNLGRRYGLVGLNGSGKSTLLNSISDREITIPPHIDIFHLSEEIAASDKTPLQCVMEVDEESMEKRLHDFIHAQAQELDVSTITEELSLKMRLEKEAEELTKSGQSESERLMDVYDRLEQLDSATAETKAARILHGLGFDAGMQETPTKDFSGGWRMRISLARALFVRPTLLLLDEPTNHLDLEACVWLEEELKRYKRILVLVSHSQDFLNGVCTNIIHIHQKQLVYYGGNYDAYVKTRAELEENQMKRYQWEKDQMQHMKDYIARFGHGSAKLARQAQSKEKVLAKMVSSGLTEKVVADKVIAFEFADCGSIPPPVIMVQNVSFRYSDSAPYIYKDLDFGIDLETRVALVGANGAGKSTLLKLIDGELVPTDGIIRKHAHVRTGRYHQHLTDHLELDLSALCYMMKCYPKEKDEEQMRRSLGKYGLTGKQQVCPMQNLSDGQRCRVVFAWLAFRKPHLLLLDEPTNHLDMETIDALADAINSFEGGMMLVSHDFRLISQVARAIWVCEKRGVHIWPGSIKDYKRDLKKKVMK